MSKLKSPVSLQTAFAEYQLDELLGEGGAGRVYGGTDGSGMTVAIKVLTTSGSDKRRRFKNEIAFLSRNTHRNVVTVIDHGVANDESVHGPFYVMDRFDRSLRVLLPERRSPDETLALFGQILDGVEAAHLLGVTHRDLKPENILYRQRDKVLAIADFGIASFTSDQLATLVETMPTQRLANFQYAAPEQRTPGRPVSNASDIYAMGLMLNEMYTNEVPHGTDYRLIANVSEEHSFLDRLVAQMIKQNPDERPRSIGEVKAHIQRYRIEAVSAQRLSKLNGVVIAADAIDDPLAATPPILVDAYWDGGVLRLTLDRPVSSEWVSALHNMGSYSSVMGYDPQRFEFRGNVATVPAREGNVQAIIDSFKAWLPQATRTLKHRLEQLQQQAQRQEAERLKREREAEEARIRVNQKLRV